MKPTVLYAIWKTNQSKSTNEINVTNHLATDGGMPLCGIHKQHDDEYTQADEPLINTQANRTACCQRCFRVAKSKYGW